MAIWPPMASSRSCSSWSNSSIGLCRLHPRTAAQNLAARREDMRQRAQPCRKEGRFAHDSGRCPDDHHPGRPSIPAPSWSLRRRNHPAYPGGLPYGPCLRQTAVGHQMQVLLQSSSALTPSTSRSLSQGRMDMVLFKNTAPTSISVWLRTAQKL
jgi:hypothetical protein